MPPVGFEPKISAGKRPQTYALGCSYIGARTDRTQKSGQTPDKEVYCCIRWGPDEERILDVVSREDGARNSG